MNVTEDRDVIDVLEVGTQAPPWELDEVTRIDFVRYAGASGDFHGVHVDETYARAAGYPTIFGHGMLVAGYLSKYLTDWMGIGTVRRLRYRFEGILWPGDRPTITGTVSRLFEEDGETLAELEMVAVNQKGETLVSAVAVASIDQSKTPAP